MFVSKMMIFIYFSKTLELLSLCKEYCEKFVEKRESEIATLKEYINGLKEEEVEFIFFIYIIGMIE